MYPTDKTIYSSTNQSGDWKDNETKSDFKHLVNRTERVIAGFLSLGKTDGWQATQGDTYETGFRFTRYMLNRFWYKKKHSLSDYQDIIEPTILSFTASPQKKFANPKEYIPRGYIDGTITGWAKHGVGRVIGNLSKKHSRNGPFFETLVNSARKKSQTHCYPFSSSVLLNHKKAKQRHETLTSLHQSDPSIAYPVFYSNSRLTPENFTAFYKNHFKKDPGPNATHLLKGLQYLNTVKMKGQVVGNCWMKQPKRCVLLCFYLQMLTQRPGYQLSEAWKRAKKLYMMWKKFIHLEITLLMESTGIVKTLISIAQKKINNYKKL